MHQCGASVVIKKAGFEIGSGAAALVAPPEPVVAVAGDPAIDGVTEGAGYHDEEVQERPRSRKPPGDAKGCSRSDVGLSVLHQHNGTEVPVQGRVGQVLLGRVGLEGCKAEDAVGIVIDDEVDGAIAEVADAVEEDDGGIVAGMIRREVTSHNRS